MWDEEVNGDEHEEAAESFPAHHPTPKRCSGGDSSEAPSPDTFCTAGVLPPLT